nr:unnamed protein product [Spirometra erinaceieuropaei]
MWLTSPGRVLLKKSNQQSKFDPLVEEVELPQCTSQYAHIRFNNGREETVSVRLHAPSGEKDVDDCHQETATLVPEDFFPLSPDHPPITEQESGTISTDEQNDATPSHVPYLMDACHDESLWIRSAYRMNGQLLKHWRMHFQSRVSTTTAHELLFPDDCALNATTKGDMQKAWTFSPPPAITSA